MSIVRLFHGSFGLPAPDVIPLRPNPDDVRLRARLIREEFEEVMAELTYLAHPHTPDETMEGFQRLLKELADLRYVTEGCAVTFGLPIESAYREVHRSNMSKLGEDGKPITREDGKVLKGPGYTEADMKQFVPDIIDQEV